MLGKDFAYKLLGIYGVENENDVVNGLSSVDDNLRAMGFNAEPPESLYRYRSVEKAISEIEGKYIHLSRVSDFSDPYDTIVGFIDILKGSGILDERFDARGLDENSLEECFSPVKDTLTVCCFAGDYRSFPMWDHYADHYSGVCVEYDCRSLRKNLYPFKVKYSKEAFGKYPGKTNNAFEYVMTSLIGCILTKNEDYSYEDEWRYFNGQAKKRVDVGSSVRRVYIGDKCGKKDVKKIVRICREKGIEAVLLKASKTRYGFDEKVLFSVGSAHHTEFS